MSKLITFLILIVALTGCESGKSGAEISALGESLMSTSAASGAAAQAVSAAIDSSPHVATTYAGAAAACAGVSRNLCTYSQYTTAFGASLLAYSTGNPGLYWMVNENVGGMGFRNTYQASTSGATVINTTVTNSQKFYCCN